MAHPFAQVGGWPTTVAQRVPFDRAPRASLVQNQRSPYVTAESPNLLNASTRTDFQERLREQYRFLTKSVAEFYSGDTSEAVRIAAIVRVLLNETGNSKPLLKQLRPNYLDLPILEKNPLPPAEPNKVIVLNIPISYEFDSKGIRPKLNLASTSYQLVRLGAWWANPCLVIPGGMAFARKDLVLTLANKEGGAHVDSSLPKEYLALIESRPVHFVYNGHELDSGNLARLMVGQSGAELTDSLKHNFAFLGESA